VSINWFTFFAQIVNFLIVVYLLKRFLFGPITRAMAEREAKIAAQFAEAEVRRQEAEQEAERYRSQRAELDAEIETLMADAAAQAGERRRAMITEARAEVESMQDRWYSAVEREKGLFLHNIRQRMGEQVFLIAKSAMGDLANADLEESIVNVFLEKVQAQELEPAAVSNVGAPPGETAIVVRSAFDLEPAARKRISQALQQRLAANHLDGDAPRSLKVEFEQDAELICGIEAQLQDRRIAWNLRDYLDSFENELEAALTADLRVEDRRAHLYEQDAAANGILPG